MSARVFLLAGFLALSGGLPGFAGAQTQVESILESLVRADPAIGEKVFAQCAACHVAKRGAPATIGPNLWNVFGRPVATESGFDYSESLQAVSGTWDAERLNVYLFDPKRVAPTGRMPFPGIKSTDERAHLIAYLGTLHDNPIVLAGAGTGASKTAIDDDPEKWQGLPPGPGREDVFYRCVACHSLMIVKQQGLSRADWDESLEWMVEEQGMPPIEDEATRERVLDYLTRHFGRE